MIVVRNLHKAFKLYQRPGDRLREVLTRRTLHRDFTALQDVSFRLEPGHTLGIIGENGSGKSTLLKLVAGVLLPDSGEILCDGKITGLLELGTGFNPELSGEENIILNGMYLRLSREQLAARRDAIVAFSELGAFIKEPLKNYSSGMVMRLAFSIAMHADPDAFIIDEALSVGDAHFQQKCFSHLKKFRKDGGSIMFVSHDMNAVKLLCDEAIVLEHGRVRYMGDPDEAVNLYNRITAGKADAADRADTEHGGYGNAAVLLESARVLDANGQPLRAVESGRAVVVEFVYACRLDVPDLSFGMMIRDRFGQDVFGVNGAMLGSLATGRAGERKTGRFYIKALNIGPGVYPLTLAAHTGETHLDTCFHWLDNTADFEVTQNPDDLFSGHTRLETRLEHDLPAQQAEADEYA